MLNISEGKIWGVFYEFQVWFIFCLCHWGTVRNTVKCCYNVVQYWSDIAYITAVAEVKNLNPQNTSHTSPWRASYGMYFVRIGEKIDRITTAPHCIMIYWNTL